MKYNCSGVIETMLIAITPWAPSVKGGSLSSEKTTYMRLFIITNYDNPAYADIWYVWSEEGGKFLIL